MCTTNVLTGLLVRLIVPLLLWRTCAGPFIKPLNVNVNTAKQCKREERPLSEARQNSQDVEQLFPRDLLVIHPDLG